MKNTNKAPDLFAVLAAVDGLGWISTKDLAAAIGLTPITTRKVLAPWLAEGRVEARKSQRYDKQENRHGLFGGCGVCVRRFWEYRLASKAWTSKG